MTASQVARAAAALVGAAALCACDALRTATCPGQPVGTLLFHADPLLDGGCPFASDAAVTFTATLGYEGDAGAVLCIDRPGAAPLRGTRNGDHVDIASTTTTAAVAACACDLALFERVEGDIFRDGGAVAFDGGLVDALSPADSGAAACERPDSATGSPPCRVPCELRWTLRSGP